MEFSKVHGNSLHRESLNRKDFAFLKSIQSKSNFLLKHVGFLFTLLVTEERKFYSMRSLNSDKHPASASIC